MAGDDFVLISDQYRVVESKLLNRTNERVYLRLWMMSGVVLRVDQVGDGGVLYVHILEIGIAFSWMHEMKSGRTVSFMHAR